MSPYSVEFQILSLLQAGHALTVRWDCGGDESFVYTAIDGEEQHADYADEKNLAVLLDRYVTDLLGLPSVGEFSMEGTGRIFQDGLDVVIEYQSQATTYWDDDDGSWMDEFTDEQLAEMGVVKTMTDEELTAYTSPKPSEESPAAPVANEEVSVPEIDQEMSDDYSGRRVLFRAS